MKLSKRSFLKTMAVTSAGALVLPTLAQGRTKKKTAPSRKKVELKENAVILFQGDSITDAGRDRKATTYNNFGALGVGYAYLTAASLLDKHAEKNLQIYNKGVSGNKVYQLRERWDQDCIELKPDVLSILIGVNDYWHTLGGKYAGDANKYLNDYRDLLTYTKEKLPNVQLVICEPFTLKGGKAITPEKWYPMFDEYRSIAKKLAEEFNATWVPFQTTFDEAVKRAPDRYWSNDGVHADLPGAKRMAQAWLKATGLGKSKKHGKKGNQA